MRFNSISFVIFFIILYILYHSLRNKFKIQNAVLLISSYLFYYLWDIRFLFLLVLITVINFNFTLMINDTVIPYKKRISTGLVLIIISILIPFFNFFKTSSNISIIIFRPENIFDFKDIFSIMGSIILIVFINIIYSVSKQWNSKIRRKFFVTANITFNLLILGIFKYYNFFCDSFSELTNYLFSFKPSFWTLNFALPVGISFYIFKSISYTIDVYRNELDSCKNFNELATYLSFFPQLLAGPIERAKNFITQLQNPRLKLSKSFYKEGIWLFCWGLYKKIVIADKMAIIVNDAFNPFDSLNIPVAHSVNGLYLAVAILAFTIQIYSDFSGYTDMARGISNLLGFKTMINFNLPYFSNTPSDFWRRWHISLSSWLRDYLYIPLGGNRSTKTKMYINLFLTMLLGGLWHGAAWNFVFWGAYHGLILIIYRIFNIGFSKDNRAWYILTFQILITFLLVNYGWLLFRAKNVETVIIITKNLFSNIYLSSEALTAFLSLLKYTWFLLIFQIIQVYKKDLVPVLKFPWLLKLTIWFIVIISLVVFTNSKNQEFIYFAF